MRTLYNANDVEEHILEFWKKNKIPEKIVKFKKNKPKFYLLDGPPYVNGIPHIGHLKTTAIKDIYSKYKTMQGFAVWYMPGFDCGGLPIENAVEKKFGITSKKEIEKKIGIDKFIEECKKFAEGNKHEWLKTYKRFGAWRGWVEPYMTYKNYYLESGWWTLKKMWEQGMLIRGTKPVFWCPRCETTLSGYEVTDSYMEIEDYSIYVKFPIKGKEFEYIVIWTTTPWTLPANVAIAVKGEENYVRVRVGGEILIIAEKRLKDVMNDIGIKNYEIIEKLKGIELEGMKYEPIIHVPLQEELKKNENAHRIILSIQLFKKGVGSKVATKKEIEEKEEHIIDFVTMDMGSGAVHTAPGHGETDYMVGEHYNLPVVSPVKDDGTFDESVSIFSGLNVRDANKKIIEYLKERNYLLYVGKIKHSYPLCWRCKTPLIYRLSTQWFLKVDLIKGIMLKELEKVKWMPDFAKERFKNWVENAIDWAISVQRYWGIPMPVWVCSKCKTIDVIGSIKELREKAISKIEKNIDLHKNVVDKIEIKCKDCGSSMHRVPDTLNVWFDSGIAPWASLGYPFKEKELVEHLMPAEFIAESQDQIRGWFYSLMFCSTAVFSKSSYKSVGMIGWILDEKGRKMSKSLGNVIYGMDAINTVGSDALRLYYCFSIAPWEVQNFSLNIAKNLNKVLNILFNIANFINSYADFSVLNEKVSIDQLKIEDKWILSRINSVINNISLYLEDFKLHMVGREIEKFILNDLSRFYIKLIRDRINKEDKKIVSFTLLYCLDNILRVMAPITPFITEKIYQDVFRRKNNTIPESIHLTKWPRVDKELIDIELEKKIEIVKELLEKTYSIRSEMGAKLRWPIDKMFVFSKENIEELSNIISKMANVKEVLFVQTIPGFIKAKDFYYGKVALKNVLKDEAFVRDLIRNIQVLRKKKRLNVMDTIDIWIVCDEECRKLIEKFKDMFKDGIKAKNIYFEEKDLMEKVRIDNVVVFIKFEKN